MRSGWKKGGVRSLSFSSQEDLDRPESLALARPMCCRLLTLLVRDSGPPPSLLPDFLEDRGARYSRDLCSTSRDCFTSSNKLPRS